MLRVRNQVLWPILFACLSVGLASATAAAESPVGTAPPPRGPSVKPLALPSFPGSYAIWGGSGSDSRGHVWFAICAKDVPAPSAHLYEYVPETETLTDRGDVVSELKRAGVYRPGEGQMKIHSRIVQAGDGHLYFASMDEQGENEDGSKSPTWGGHLWRLRLPENKWEHLLTAPEALLAASASGRWVYSLGYFGLALYQYDTQTGQSRSIRVGSVDGHVTRSFLSDRRGHVYVPRLARPGGPKAETQVTLVELDTELKEVKQTPLAHYLNGKPTDCHGIVALQELADGTLHFLTHMGALCRIQPKDDGAADVRELGWFHPRGSSYSASLFTPDGKHILVGQSRPEGESRGRYEWVSWDLTTGQRTARPFEVTAADFPPMEQVLLYGSMTRDRAGGYYVVGTHLVKNRPLVLKVQDEP